ncbi:Nephrocystin-3 [Stylophora pistillata]|uniref:Nephrocystin-3 n=1 Tax=Stylophora pistillata TaxID=50429 RepID=A0A2B4RYI6_STYPI|nr:Nephrocystin-3 [Stylophora pistillata]
MEKQREMASAPVYSKKQLNYFRICYIVTNIFPQELRSIFKQQWDTRYKATLGEWKDTPGNGLDFYNNESPHSRTRNTRLLEIVKKGDRKQWDCTTLFFAMLHSDSISHGLSATAKSSVDDLREFRNVNFAHVPWGQLSDLEFILAVRRVKIAFKLLGRSLKQVEEVSKQESFETEEVQSLKKKCQLLQRELEETKVELGTAKKQLETSEQKCQLVKEQLEISEERREVLKVQLIDDVSSFCILPPRPSHEIATRDDEVAEITEELDQLKEVNKNFLSYLYITGNPGSGKSQLAGLIAEKFYNKVNSETSLPSFVMTLNAENLETLLESYVTLARQVKCPEYNVTDTSRFKETSIVEKIKNLRDLIATKLHLYASWLVVVDNVLSVSERTELLPQSGNKRWSQGQLLITTQDTLSIPPTCSFISHFSISLGMKPIEAWHFLAKIAGFADQEMEDEVAKALDYQPLALASAGTYIRKIRECNWSANFGWKKYLEKLRKGTRALTEEVLTKTNPAYSKSMTVATRLAVERAIGSDSIMKHSFTLLSLCAPQALHLDVLTNYILNIDEHVDKDVVAIQIEGYSLFLFEERENGVFIGMHQVVWDSITFVISHEESQGYAQTVCAAVKSFNEFIEIQPFNAWYDTDSIANTKHLIAHFKALAINMKHFFAFEEECQVFREGVSNVSDWSSCFHRIGIVCENHCELSSAEYYYYTALKLVEPTSDTVANSASIYQRLGNLQRSMGDLKKAIEYLELSIAIYVEKRGPEDVNVAMSHHNLGNALLELNDWKQASEHFQLALEIYKKTHGTDHVDVASISYNLGIAQHKMGNLQQALTHFHFAVVINKKIGGPDSVDVAHTYQKLGVVQRELGNLQQAKESLVRALDIFKTELGSTYANVAQTYLNLGIVQRELGDLRQAKESLDHALDIFKTELGSEHVDVAQTYLNLGIVQRELGNLQQAMNSLHLALNIFTKELGPDHVEVASCYEDLGKVQHALGDLPCARVLCMDALEIKLRSLGPEHIAVARTYINLSDLLSDLRHFQQAKECCERALEIYKRRPSSEHVDVARTYQSLGKVHYELGDLQQAKERYEHALGIYKRRPGSEHVDVARTYQGLGKVHYMLGDLQQAKECFEYTLGIYKERIGSEHADVGLTYQDLGKVHDKLGLGKVYYKLGDLQQAKESYKHALGIYKRMIGSEHVDVALIYHNLGKANFKLGDLQQAKECYEHALGIYKRSIGSENVDVALTYRGLSKAHYKLGDLQQAKECFEHALSIYKRRLGSEHVDVASTYQSLGVVYRKLGHRQQANEYYKRALGICEKRHRSKHIDFAIIHQILGKTAQHNNNTTTGNPK